MKINSSVLKHISRAISIILAFVLLQAINPVVDNVAFTASQRFSLLTPEVKTGSSWQSAKTFFVYVSKYAGSIKMPDNFKFSKPAKVYKIVKVESKRKSTKLSWPVIGRITSGFGMRIHPITKRRAFHYGIDIGARRGTLVKSPANGVVVSVGRAGRLGRLVRVRTKNGLLLYFGHLDRYKCKKGQIVKRGQLLGTVGATGRTTGPHLHFSVKYHHRFMNPMKYLSAL